MWYTLATLGVGMISLDPMIWDRWLSEFPFRPVSGFMNESKNYNSLTWFSYGAHEKYEPNYYHNPRLYIITERAYFGILRASCSSMVCEVSEHASCLKWKWRYWEILN
jgi:hypothetical protein